MNKVTRDVTKLLAESTGKAATDFREMLANSHPRYEDKLAFNTCEFVTARLIGYDPERPAIDYRAIVRHFRTDS